MFGWAQSGGCFRYRDCFVNLNKGLIDDLLFNILRTTQSFDHGVHFLEESFGNFNMVRTQFFSESDYIDQINWLIEISHLSIDLRFLKGFGLLIFFVKTEEPSD